MFPVDLNDILLYLVVSSVVVLLHPLRWWHTVYTFRFILGSLCKAVERRVTPFPYRSHFSQQATTKGYILVQYLKAALANETKPFNEVGLQFLTESRRSRHAAHGLGDVTVQRKKHLRVFQSKSRGQFPIDLLVLYFHGGLGLGDENGELYTEFLCLLVVKFLEQGFTNPVIVVPKYGKGNGSVSVGDFVPPGSNCHLVVASDSVGSSFAMRQMREMAANFPGGVAAAVLISPVVGEEPGREISEEPSSTAPDDYICRNTIDLWKKQLGSKFTTSTAAEPRYGWYITYGSEEFLAPAIEALAQSVPGKVKLDRQLAQVHNWPLVCFWTETTIYDREVSIEAIAVQVSRMVLWNTSSYFDTGPSQPRVPPNIDEVGI